MAEVVSISQKTGRDESFHKPHPRTKFTKPEDVVLAKLVTAYGENNWELISKLMVGRNARQCKERWFNYLSPNVQQRPWTPEEDLLLQAKLKELGRKWVDISKYFVNRTDTMLKNRYNVLSRRAKKQLTNKIISQSTEVLPKEIPSTVVPAQVNIELPKININDNIATPPKKRSFPLPPKCQCKQKNE